MYTHTARYYDRIYDFKDFAGEVERLLVPLKPLLQRRTRPSLLDVACGTGRHLALLREHFEVEGLDLDPEMLEIAHERLPGVTLHQADLRSFDLDRRFDVVCCLFSSIGYVKTLDRLQEAVRSMARHLEPGGVLALEPWFTPESWRTHTVHGIYIDEPELKLARISTSERDGRVSWMDMHYLIGTPEGTRHEVERHELGLFTHEELRQELEDAGLEVSYDDQGLSGRGLWLGRRVTSS